MDGDESIKLLAIVDENGFVLFRKLKVIENGCWQDLNNNDPDKNRQTCFESLTHYIWYSGIYKKEFMSLEFFDSMLLLIIVPKSEICDFTSS